jgi:dTDP-4-dehydrorhamnose 3,5-epimerase-like enzyme
MPDSRGSFSKILGEGDSEVDSPFRTREIFWSRSAVGVARGLHVQLPPRSTRKLVFVTSGTVRDFVLDLRRGSPTEGVVWETELDPDSGGLVIPDGCAHGFEVVSLEAVMVYAQEDFHSPDHDAGVDLRSAGIVLRAEHPVISDRDLALPSLRSFDSPFGYA